MIFEKPKVDILSRQNRNINETARPKSIEGEKYMDAFEVNVAEAMRQTYERTEREVSERLNGIPLSVAWSQYPTADQISVQLSNLGAIFDANSAGESPAAAVAPRVTRQRFSTLLDYLEMMRRFPKFVGLIRDA
jgi:hypothetical protein